MTTQPFNVGYAQGGEGALGIAISWRPGDTTDPARFVAPDQWMLAEAKPLEQTFIHIEHDAFVGSRDTDKGHRHGKAKGGGPITFALYPTNGKDVWEGGLGFKTTLTAQTADTTTAILSGQLTTPTAPTATGSATGGTLAAGAYTYAVKFVDAYGTSYLSPGTTPYVASGGLSSVALSVIPIGDATVTARQIFRKKDAGTFNLIHTISDNTTTTYTDTGAADGAADTGVYSARPSGLSILSLTTGDTHTVGKIVEVGDPSSGIQEVRLILKYDSVGKNMYVALLDNPVGSGSGQHPTAGTSVVVPQQDLERTIVATDFSRPMTNLLPRVSVEDNKAGKFSYQYRDGLVGKINLKSQGTKTTVQADIMFSKGRKLCNGLNGNPDPTPFDDTDVSLEDLSFEYQDGFLAFEHDADDSGTPSLQRMDDVVDWELDIDNNLKEENAMDGGPVLRHLPGAKRKMTLKWKSLLKESYPVIYEQFVSKDKDGTFFGQFAINEGSVTSPVWKVRAFYAPHVRYIESKSIDGLTDTEGEEVSAVLRRAGGQEKLYVYSIT